MCALFLFFMFFGYMAATTLTGIAGSAGLAAIDHAVSFMIGAGNMTATRWTYLFCHLYSPPLLK
jgi:hypothetical protein